LVIKRKTEDFFGMGDQFHQKVLSISAAPTRFGKRTSKASRSRPTSFESASLSQDYLNAAGRYLAPLSRTDRAYPFQQFSIVENFFPTGYGFPSYTLLGSTVIRLPFIIETSLGHEIAHCWWGNGVLVDYSHGTGARASQPTSPTTSTKNESLTKRPVNTGFRSLGNFTTLVNPGDDFPLSQFRNRYDPASQASGMVNRPWFSTC